ncbi:unnamed protein product [Arabidopsis halleri]
MKRNLLLLLKLRILQCAMEKILSLLRKFEILIILYYSILYRIDRNR